ncbi:MAG: c-type cytochrome biogenesis protein CcsB [Candidatus Eremiobacterales bacterium]|jgi:cytochrome c-type biogenesis protein CcsB
MPDYSQYNTNAQALADAHVAAYMAWYHVAIVLYVLAAAVFLAYWFFRNRPTAAGGAILATAGLGCQMASLGIRWVYSGHVPWNDLYGSLSVVALLSVALFLIFGLRYKIWFAGPIVLSVTDALLAYGQGWNKGLEPLVPSLQNNYWIYYHVPVVLAAYAAFLIGFSTSILYLLKKHDEDRALAGAGKSVGAAVAAVRPAWLDWLDIVPASGALEVITYRVIAIGEILLTVGVILGSLWAHDAWGSYWQNDPKELAALTCWIWYAAYLHLHTRPSFRGPRLAWMSIAGFGVVLFCYFGVNIWISGLHSYK